jgi:uncharacterized protein YbaR (Trm112 family)
MRLQTKTRAVVQWIRGKLQPRKKAKPGILHREHCPHCKCRLVAQLEFGEVGKLVESLSCPKCSRWWPPCFPPSVLDEIARAEHSR